MSSERWRSVIGFPNYEVSDLGRVRSIARLRTHGGLLKLQTDGNGYPCVQLYAGTKKSMKRRNVCVLVLEAFVGPRPPGMECRHYPSRNRTDSRLVNLRWGTSSQNRQDSREHGTLFKHNAIDVERLFDLKACRCVHAEIAEWLCMSTGTVSNIFNGKGLRI